VPRAAMDRGRNEGGSQRREITRPDHAVVASTSAAPAPATTEPAVRAGRRRRVARGLSGSTRRPRAGRSASIGRF
jgi:hypothetical protein